MSVKMNEYKLSYDGKNVNVSINNNIVGNLTEETGEVTLGMREHPSESDDDNITKLLTDFMVDKDTNDWNINDVSKKLDKPYIKEYPSIVIKTEKISEIKTPNYTKWIIISIIITILGLVLQIGLAIFFVWLPFMIWAGVYALKTEKYLSREDYNIGRILINTVKGPFFIYKYYKTFGTLSTSILN